MKDIVIIDEHKIVYADQMNEYCHGNVYSYIGFPDNYLSWQIIKNFRTWDLGTYCMCEQQRLKLDCTYEQSCLSLWRLHICAVSFEPLLLHTHSRDIDECLD